VKPKKLETRNPKCETNPNDQKAARSSKQVTFGFRFLDLGFESGPAPTSFLNSSIVIFGHERGGFFTGEFFVLVESFRCWCKFSGRK